MHRINRKRAGKSIFKDQGKRHWLGDLRAVSRHGKRKMRRLCCQESQKEGRKCMRHRLDPAEGQGSKSAWKEILDLVTWSTRKPHRSSPREVREKVREKKKRSEK